MALATAASAAPITSTVRPRPRGTVGTMSDAVHQLWLRGCARWPNLPLPAPAFARRIEPDAEAEVHAEDLFLAIACVEHVAGAATAFRGELGGAISDFVRTVLHEQAAVIELEGDLLVDFLVGEAGVPRLVAYTGRGPLRAWVRMTCVRRALNSRRDTTRRAEIDGRMLCEAIGTATDPETSYLKQLYGAAFEQAFREAVATLDPTESTLLRLHFGEGLALGALGAMYGWSKPTASRRIAAAREALFVATSELLRARLKLSPPELASVLRLIRSNLDISLCGIFSPDPDA